MRADGIASSPGSNMNDWASALSEVNPELATRLDESRSVGFEKLQTLGLPRYKHATLGLIDFLKDPVPVLELLEADQYYITLIPTIDDLRRFSRSGISASQLLEYVEGAVAPEQIGVYDIVVQQYFENRYGGCAVINPDGQIYIEFIKGKQTPVAKGTALAEFTVRNDPFTGVMRYSFDSPDLRKGIYGMLQAIPHEGQGREAQYTPGYYEFILVAQNSEDQLRSIFIDYKDEPLYYLPKQS